MFTEIAAANFKSWDALPPTRLAPVTGFFGSNSSGKTSILQMLLLLKQTSVSTDRGQPFQLGDGRTEIELGSFRDLVYNHSLEEPLGLRLDWQLPETLKVIDPITEDAVLFAADDIRFETSVSGTANGGMEVDGFRYDAGPASVSMTRSTRRHGRKDPEYELSATIHGRDYLKRSPGRAWPLPSPVKCYGFPDEAIGYYQNSGFLSDLELEFVRQFGDRTFYLGPLRGYPARQYQWKGTHPEDVGEAGQRAVEALLASRERGKINARAFDSRGHAKRRITVERHVAEWLRDLGLVSSFEVERLSQEADIYRVLVKKTEASAPVFLTDVGFGVSQILPVLVLLAYVPSGSTVVLEQPEIHLHPAVQAGLADVIIEAATIRRVQVILESHSEHLLRRLQLRVAEETISPDLFALYFCEVKRGRSQIASLDMNLFGEIENWPKDFFGNPLGETAAMTRAALRRRIAQ